MGSTPTIDPIPWQPPPYYAYRDCSLRICTIYCPQWCTAFFPPPPDPSSESGVYFSPLVVSVIVILAGALLLVSYFTIFKKTRGRRRSNSMPVDENRDSINNGAPAGLEDSAIKSITVQRYKKGGGVVEGTDCSVCLSEFQDDENLRLMPKCNHAFHLNCIDTWLKSHSNCPLCRANVAPSVESSPLEETPATIIGSPLPRTDEDDVAVGRDEVVVTVFDGYESEGQGRVQVADIPSEQHEEEEEDGGDDRCTDHVPESRSAISTGGFATATRK